MKKLIEKGKFSTVLKIFSKPRPHKNSLATSVNLEGRFLSYFFFELSRSNVCEKYLLTEDCS